MKGRNHSSAKANSLQMNNVAFTESSAHQRTKQIHIVLVMDVGLLKEPILSHGSVQIEVLFSPQRLLIRSRSQYQLALLQMRSPL